jgi:hypothetical protein
MSPCLVGRCVATPAFSEELSVAKHGHDEPGEREAHYKAHWIANPGIRFD